MRILTGIILIMMPLFVFAADSGEEIRVMIEAMEPTPASVEEGGAYIKSEKKFFRTKAGREARAAELKKLAETKMESEIIDALIGKIIDLEAEADRQANIDKIIFIILHETATAYACPMHRFFSSVKQNDQASLPIWQIIYLQPSK